MKSGGENHILDAAYGIIVADGCFGLAFVIHLLGLPPGGLAIWDFAGAGILLSAFLSACWIIHDQYWQMKGPVQKNVVKMLRIKELQQGARIEFDGKSYQVDRIDRANGEILIQRVGQPGRIIVQIEGLG